MRFEPQIIIRSTLVMCLLMIVSCLALTRGVTPVNAEVSNQPSPMAVESDHTGEIVAECELSSAYPEQVRRWCSWITQYSRQHDLPPDLVAALIWYESGGNPEAYSRSGAVGLMQVMPRDGIAAEFQCVNGPCFASRPTIEELMDPEFNIEYGTRMLAGLYARYQDWRLALKAYGPMDVGFAYADKLLAIYERYRENN